MVLQNIKLIGLHGFAQCGKDTVGKYLVENYGFTRVSFADAVRDALAALNPYIATRTNGVRLLSELLKEWDWERAKQEPNVRELLQRMGTEVGREIFGQTVWLDIADRKLDGLERAVITDCRFPNEVGLVKVNGGEVWRITRKGVGSINSHVSDKGLSDEYIDRTIENDSTLEALYARVDELMNQQAEVGYGR